VIYTKENPIGIDIPIQNLQKYLYGKLCKIWGISEDEYTSYCRVYRNQTKDGYIPEFYKGNNEYSESLPDDRVSALSFFSMTEKATNNMGAITQNVALIFSVNIEKLNKNVPHRADEEIRQDVIELVNSRLFGFEFLSIETGIKNVFKEYKTEGIKFNDMHPYHCFRLNLKIKYNKC